MPRLILRCAFLSLCGLAAFAPLKSKQFANDPATFPPWPTEWNGEPLTAVLLDDREARFSQNFPGRIAKFTDGRRELIFRWVSRPTRQLHSSADCFRGMGYSITPQPAIRDLDGKRWSCFLAIQKRHQFRVRERITGKEGQEWTDVSAWFWNVLFQQKRGPWLSITVVENTALNN
jgi:hypothetical protein